MLYLLDTNIVIAIIDGDVKVKRHASETDEVAVPSIVVGELFFGAQRSARIEQNVTRINEFAATVRILHVDAQSAAAYGVVKAKLYSAGRPIPENDIWIAALAFQHDGTLVTRDAHFAFVDDLAVADWQALKTRAPEPGDSGSADVV